MANYILWIPEFTLTLLLIAMIVSPCASLNGHT